MSQFHGAASEAIETAAKPLPPTAMVVVAACPSKRHGSHKLIKTLLLIAATVTLSQVVGHYLRKRHG